MARIDKPLLRDAWSKLDGGGPPELLRRPSIVCLMREGEPCASFPCDQGEALALSWDDRWDVVVVDGCVAALTEDRHAYRLAKARARGDG